MERRGMRHHLRLARYAKTVQAQHLQWKACQNIPEYTALVKGRAYRKAFYLWVATMGDQFHLTLAFLLSLIVVVIRSTKARTEAVGIDHAR